MKSLLKLACIAAVSFTLFSCAEPSPVTPADVYYAHPETRPTHHAEVSAQAVPPVNEKSGKLSN